MAEMANRDYGNRRGHRRCAFANPRQLASVHPTSARWRIGGVLAPLQIEIIVATLEAPTVSVGLFAVGARIHGAIHPRARDAAGRRFLASGPMPCGGDLSNQDSSARRTACLNWPGFDCVPCSTVALSPGCIHWPSRGCLWANGQAYWRLASSIGRSSRPASPKATRPAYSSLRPRRRPMSSSPSDFLLLP
jgi:hypothetical protein